MGKRKTKKDHLPRLDMWPKDWEADEALKMCSLAAEGLWLRLTFLMHRSPRRGFLLLRDGSVPSSGQLGTLISRRNRELSGPLRELKQHGVCSVVEAEDEFEDVPVGTIYCRRMIREEVRKEAARKAAEARWSQAKRRPKRNAESDADVDAPPGDPIPFPSPDLNSGRPVAEVDRGRAKNPPGRSRPSSLSRLVERWNAEPTLPPEADADRLVVAWTAVEHRLEVNGQDVDEVIDRFVSEAARSKLVTGEEGDRGRPWTLRELLRLDRFFAVHGGEWRSKEKRSRPSQRDPHSRPRLPSADDVLREKGMLGDPYADEESTS